MPSCCIIIPCFNEEKRLRPDAFYQHILQNSSHRLLFIDDHSTDKTANALLNIKQGNEEHIDILTNEKTLGKAETVRKGMLYALKYKCDYFSYLDADLSAPLSTISNLMEVLENEKQYCIAFASRLKGKGKTIERSILRQYLGRIFTRYIDGILHLGFYDTQCGAKVFQSAIVEKAFNTPFVTKWFFDIEIALKAGKEVIVEVPIKKWIDYGYSTLNLRDYLTAPLEILKISRKYRKGHSTRKKMICLIF